MNYLNYKNSYPNAVIKFFNWCSQAEVQKTNDYVDNVYFYKFFDDIFRYCTYSGVLIDNPKFVSELKLLLLDKEKVISEGFPNFKNVSSGTYQDTNTDYFRIKIKGESDFENAFFILELLIVNRIYE